MTGTAYRYFARGHTARGGYSLYASALQGVRKLFMIQGYPGTGQSEMLRRLGERMTARGLDIQLFHSPLHPGEIEAVIVTDLKTAFVDGAASGISEIDSAETAVIDWRSATDAGRISGAMRASMDAWEERRREALSHAYDAFAEALRIHDEWESFYISNMDFRKADELANELADSLFGDRTLSKQAAVRHLFLGAATPEGAVDHIQNLTSAAEKRIFIKGRAGTGKSTLLKRLAAEGGNRGFDVETFHCGFDPNSLDMLIFPELGLAIFDSTAPHEHFPELAGDTVLDMYARLVSPGIDERYEAELNRLKQRYANQMRGATSHLAEAGEMDDRIGAAFAAVTDFSAVDRVQRRLESAVEDLFLPSNARG